MPGGTHPFTVFIRTLGRGKKAGRDLTREESLAAMGMLTPTIAGAAMALSSVSVVSNSLLLRRWKPDFSKTD